MSTKSTTAAKAAPKASAKTRIAENTILLALDFSAFGLMRTIDSRDIVDAEEADPSEIKAQKRLLDCDEYRAIKRIDAEAKAFVYSRSLPSLFKSGVYMVPNTLVEQVDSVLEDYSGLRKEAVEAFIAALPGIKEKAKGALKGQYREADYPDAPTMRAHFGFKWSYVALETPMSLKAVSKKLYEREQRKAELQWKEATDELQKLLRAQALSLVEHMTDKLKPGADGKKKIFRDTMTEKIGDFLAVFEARNIADDKELGALVERAKDLLDGVDAQLLRENDRLKNRIAAGMDEIKAELSKMVTTAPSRAIDLSGENV